MIIQSYNTIPSELERLSRFLSTHQVCSGANKIAEAIGKWNFYTSNDEWGYEVEQLTFNIDNVRHDMLNQIAGAELNLDVTVKGILNTQQEAILTEMQVNIFITGCMETNNGSCMDVATSWHIDFHNEEIFKKRDGTDNIKDNGRGCHHPLFHIQHGGDKLTQFRDDSQCDFGNYFLLKSPRWECQPFDIVLVIDHILSNYLCEKWNAFRYDEEYIQLVEEAKIRFIIPYIQQQFPGILE